jgi:phosphoribosylanthranilate isomerase
VKVCCIQSAAEVRMALEAGATHVGLVASMPSGPGPLPDEEIAGIAADAPADVTTVLLTSRTRAADIAAHVVATGVDAVQIVREVPAAVRHAVRQALPGIRIFQVVHVEGPEALAQAREAAEGSDTLLLDSGRPSRAVAELGGTGRTHDWSVSAGIVRRSPLPVFLAGGLNPENVAGALREVGPAGVDLCSGIRDEEGRLEPGRLAAFMQAVKGDFQPDSRPSPSPATEVPEP